MVTAVGQRSPVGLFNRWYVADHLPATALEAPPTERRHDHIGPVRQAGRLQGRVLLWMF